MKPPEELKGRNAKETKRLRTIWSRLFGATFRPSNNAQIEMAERYCNLKVRFTDESEKVDEGGTVIIQANGTTGTNPHYRNMMAASKEMLSIWRQIESCMIAPVNDDDDVGEFGKL